VRFVLSKQAGAMLSYWKNVVLRSSFYACRALQVNETYTLSDGTKLEVRAASSILARFGASSCALSWHSVIRQPKQLALQDVSNPIVHIHMSVVYVLYLPFS